MKSLIWIAIFCVIAVAAAYLGYNYGINSVASSADSINVNEPVQPASIRGQGRLQPAGGTISIVAQPGERVDQLMVKVGDPVKKNSPVVALASRQLRKLEWELAQSRQAESIELGKFQTTANQFKLDAADIASSEAESASSKVVNQSQAIKPLRTNLKSAQRILDKLTSMRVNPLTQDLIGQSEIDKQHALVASIKAQIQLAEGEVSLGNQSAQRAQTLAQSQRELAKFNLDNAGNLIPTESLALAIKMAKLGYDATLLKSPIKGKVLDIGIFPGDTVTTRPLMLIGNTEKMVCIAEITDSQLRDVKEGAEVEMTSAALKTTLKGKVVEIGTMIGPPSMANPNPYAAVDRKTGKVRIELDAEAARIAADFVNMQVEVKVMLTVSKESTPKDSTSATQSPENDKKISKHAALEPNLELQN